MKVEAARPLRLQLAQGHLHNILLFKADQKKKKNPAYIQREGKQAVALDESSC